MYRSHSSISYNILHGIHVPNNLSIIFAYLSHFPPPPPVLPGPPPRRSWTCSSHSSCSISNGHNYLTLGPYTPSDKYNQTKSLKNNSQISITSPSSSISNYLIDLFHENQFLFILLSIFILSLALVLICSLILFVYFQRRRQQPSRSNDKNKKFYYNLIPRRRTTNNNNEQKLVRLRKNNSSTPSQVIRIDGIHNNDNEEAV